jgi:hypothetical protein
VIEYRWAEGHYDRLPALAADLVGRKVNLIVAPVLSSALAAKSATSIIPIVFVSDYPVEYGLVASLARPGGNLTGVSVFSGELLSKRLELISELVPQSRVIALLVNPNTRFAENYIRNAQEAARAKEVQLRVLKAGTESVARRQPAVMVFEDLHWSDPTSREFLDLLVERIEQLPLLLIATFRPEFDPPWTGLRQVTLLTLARLERGLCTTLVERMAGGMASLRSDVIDEMVRRTDGVPLFLEELTKAVLEATIAGDDDGRRVVAPVPPISLAIPVTLHASLMARLDRLGAAAREIAQVGAAIGRDFTYELLAATAEPDRGLSCRRDSQARRCGTCVPTRPAARGDLFIQARACPRHCIQHAAARSAPGTAREDRPRARTALP